MFVFKFGYFIEFIPPFVNIICSPAFPIVDWGYRNALTALNVGGPTDLLENIPYASFWELG
jgi:hypothetical protein